MLNNRIDAAIIAKDEASNIPELMSNLVSFCNRIVLVDTGSMDNTATLASSLGADVYFHSWTNSFADSRNHALNHTTAEWILSIDADERIDTNCLQTCAELMANPEIGGIRVNIINYTNSEQTQFTEHRYTRLFRRDNRIRFSGAIHEQINQSILDAGYQIVDSDVNIYHYGYINPSDEKKQRNITLLAQEIAQEPDSNWHKFHLASAEFANNNTLLAKELFTQVVAGGDIPAEQLEMAIVRLAQIALKESNHQEIDRLSLNTIENANLRGLLKSIQATSLLERKRFAEAYSLYCSEEILSSSMVDSESIKSMLAALKEVL